MTERGAGEHDPPRLLTVRDSAYFRRIGALGNRAGAAAKGNAAQRASLGPDGYADHQRRGGEALLAKYGREHYAAIVRKRWASER